MVKRLFRRSLILTVISELLIFFFTRELLYCIMFIFGALLSLAGFFVMIKLVDRIVEKSGGKLFFFFVSFIKLLVITAAVFAISKFPEINLLYFIGGLSLLVVSLLLEGGSQLFRSLRNGA